MSDEDIARKMGISKSTFYKWKNEHSDISDALKKGKEICDFEAEEVLLGLFEGHYVEDEVQDVYSEQKGKEPERVVKKHIHKVKRWVEPNPTAIIFYLKSRAGWKEQWQRDDLSQRKEEFEYKKQKDAGETAEIEDLDDVESEIYEESEEEKDDSV